MHVTEDVGLLVNKNRNIIDDYEKAEIFSSTFAEVFTVDNRIFPIMNENVRTNLSDMVFEPYMVERELSMLKSRCNTSPDDVPAIFLKRLCTSIALPLSIIFNVSMRSGDVPMLWKEAIVKPLYKKRGRTDPCNYRPISLTSSVSKTMERLIRRNIVSYLNKHSLLHDSQFGFRNNRSTESQLLEYNRKLLGHCISNKSSLAVYIDFRKAFDKVSIPKLIAKLKYYGIRGNVSKWLENFLTGRTQKIRISNAISEPMLVTSGVSQRSVLGPLLFIMFINDFFMRTTLNSLAPIQTPLLRISIQFRAGVTTGR
uniref:Reverse transcriptase domain-containing protein n=1 Tax=Caenorhabditis japonica TaxID=281687 RepID=A0A8R1HM88_CAEJA